MWDWCWHESLRSQKTLSRPPNKPRKTVSTKHDRGIFGGLWGFFGGPCYSETGDIYISSACVSRYLMYFSVSRNFWMRAPIEVIPVAPGSSRKDEQKITRASSGYSGHLRGSLLLRTKRHLHFVRVCVLISYVLFHEPQLSDASSNRGDSGGVAKLSKS